MVELKWKKFDPTLKLGFRIALAYFLRVVKERNGVKYPSGAVLHGTFFVSSADAGATFHNSSLPYKRLLVGSSSVSFLALLRANFNKKIPSQNFFIIQIIAFNSM